MLVCKERVTRRTFIRSRCDNDPRPFNDLPKAYWHGTVLPYGVSEIIFKHDNIRPFLRPMRRGYLTRTITNASAQTSNNSTWFPMRFSPSLCDCRFLDRRTHTHTQIVIEVIIIFFTRECIIQAHNIFYWKLIVATENARENRCPFRDDLLTISKRRLLINLFLSL